MSERMTAIYLPGTDGSSVWADYGRQSVDHMIALIRDRAEHMKAEAEKILAASENDFHVETYVGVNVCRNREVLQEGRKL